jgi:hypothetical protein
MKNTSAILLVERPFGPHGFGLENRRLTAVHHATSIERSLHSQLGFCRGS